MQLPDYKLVRGNAKKDSQNTRGWFIGAFVNSVGLQKNDDVEVKWGEHPKGEFRTSKAKEGQATTLSLLIKGKYGIIFKDQEEILLKEAGDYLMWNPNVAHTCISYKDTLIITVRWPSLNDQKN